MFHSRTRRACAASRFAFSDRRLGCIKPARTAFRGSAPQAFGLAGSGQRPLARNSSIVIRRLPATYIAVSQSSSSPIAWLNHAEPARRKARVCPFALRASPVIVVIIVLLQQSKANSYAVIPCQKIHCAINRHRVNVDTNAAIDTGQWSRRHSFPPICSASARAASQTARSCL